MSGMPPWNDTVILVVWDDWGGWYDHVGAGLGSAAATPTDIGCRSS
ncbi:MAG: alkaline phosphatase family protein [Terriglobales bacterium]